jgi:hypothetical protein
VRCVVIPGRRASGEPRIQKQLCRKLLDSGFRRGAPGITSGKRKVRQIALPDREKTAARNQCFSGYRLTKPSRFGIFTFGKVSAFMTSLSPITLLPARMKAVSA